MKGIILGGLAIGLLANAPAFAADIPVKAPPRVVEDPWTWAGAYVGGFVGGAWSEINSYQADANNSVFSLNYPFTPQKASSWIAGVNTGYNLQFGQFVLGIESTYAGTRLIAHSSDIGDNNVERTVPRTSKIGVITTTTGRVGWAAADRWLLFAKGGGAWAQQDRTNSTINNTNGNLLTSRTGSDWLSGWTAGGGVAWALTRNVSFKVEYDYIKLNNKIVSNVLISCITGAVCNSAPLGDITQNGVRGDIHMIVAGVNVNMNTFLAPK